MTGGTNISKVLRFSVILFRCHGKLLFPSLFTTYSLSIKIRTFQAHAACPSNIYDLCPYLHPFIHKLLNEFSKHMPGLVLCTKDVVEINESKPSFALMELTM